MCSIRCTSCGQLLYAERVVVNTIQMSGNIPEHSDELVCHACGIIGDVSMLGNSLENIINNLQINDNATN